MLFMCLPHAHGDEPKVLPVKSNTVSTVVAVMYTSEEAENFWDVFGKNAGCVIAPEETMADTFAFTIVYGLDGKEYNSPEIIQSIDAYLKTLEGEL